MNVIKKLKSDWLETVTAVILSSATVLSAWCVYESSQWSGEQYFRIEDENMADRKRMQKVIASQQRLTAETQLFMQYASAISNKNQEFSDFLFSRFPDHLKKATLAWHRLDPMHNPDAPASPMQMNEYVLPEEADIAKYDKQAKEFKREANKCDNNADNYLLLSMVLSMVLFFCGLSGVMDSRTNKLILLSFAGVLFLISIYFAIQFPVVF